MSVAVDMERIDGGGGSGGTELSIGDMTAQTRISSGSGSGGGGSSPREVLDLLGPSRNIPGGGGKKHRRLRKHFHQQQQHHKKGKQRIRRNTQSAPNNTNEFLMQEHDHLFHLDFDNEDWDHHHRSAGGPGGTEFGVGGTENPNPGQNSLAFYSSSDDDQDYLQREFSATYDNVNAERLSSMTKSELISEYQMLQERVETLERKLKTAEDAKPSEVNLTLSDDDKLRLVQNEILKLRDENHKVKSANKYLRKLMYRGPLYVPPNETEADNYMEADQISTISTDSGGGSGSVE